MPFITKLSRDPLGEFTIKFSIKSGHFEITNWPVGVADKVDGSGEALLTWDDVNRELDWIQNDYMHKVFLQRKVIVIQIKTSASNFITEKKKFKLSSPGDVENSRTNDYLEDAEGFQIIWSIAEEYLYPNNKLKYKIIERNKNSRFERWSKKRIEVKGQVFNDYNGEIRMIEYREDLHEFLKSLDGKINDMLKQLIAYFDIDENKFLENFEKNKIFPLSLNKVLSFKEIKNPNEISIDDAGFSNRTFHVLQALECETLGAVVKFKKSDLFTFRNVGRVTVEEIESVLNVFGLKLTEGISKSPLLTPVIQRDYTRGLASDHLK